MKDLEKKIKQIIDSDYYDINITTDSKVEAIISEIKNYIDSDWRVEDATLEYEGYKATIHYSKSDNCLYGKINNIKDLVAFDSESLDTIEQKFHEAVDNYIEYIKEN